MFSIWPPSALSIGEQRFLKFSKDFSNMFSLSFLIFILSFKSLIGFLAMRLGLKIAQQKKSHGFKSEERGSRHVFL